MQYARYKFEVGGVYGGCRPVVLDGLWVYYFGKRVLMWGGTVPFEQIERAMEEVRRAMHLM